MVIISEGRYELVKRGALGVFFLKLGNLAMLLMWGLLVVNPATDTLGPSVAFAFFRVLGESVALDAELVMGLVALSLAVGSFGPIWRKWPQVNESALLSVTVFWGVLLFGAIWGAIQFRSSTPILAGAFYLTFLWFALAGWALSSDKVKV